jgi:hypothetical protein
MSGQRRLFRGGNRAPPLLASKLDFGVVAFVLLAAIAILTLISRDSVAAARAFSRAIAVA